MCMACYVDEAMKSFATAHEAAYQRHRTLEERVFLQDQFAVIFLGQLLVLEPQCFILQGPPAEQRFVAARLLFQLIQLGWRYLLRFDILQLKTFLLSPDLTQYPVAGAAGRKTIYFLHGTKVIFSPTRRQMPAATSYFCKNPQFAAAPHTGGICEAGAGAPGHAV